jgi:hypothetical protein
MTQAPGYKEGHLVVAAVRILEDREHHPPTIDEIAGLLRWHPEQVGLIARGLAELEILRPVTTPYDVRYELLDHGKLEELQQADEGPGFADELAEFDRKTQQEQEKLERLFQSGDAEEQRQRRVKALDEEFGHFKKSKPVNPFGDD